MKFLDVNEVPEHDKKFGVRVSVCVCVCVCKSVTTITPLFSELQSSQWCQNLPNFIVMSFRARQFRDVRDKNVTLSVYF
jgi:hypothetical protein